MFIKVRLQSKKIYLKFSENKYIHAVEFMKSTRK